MNVLDEFDLPTTLDDECPVVTLRCGHVERCGEASDDGFKLEVVVRHRCHGSEDCWDYEPGGEH